MNLINTYGNIGNTDIDNMQLTIDYQRRGYYEVTLTEMDTTTIPQVAEGSMIEVGGALYEAQSDETISSSASTGTNYIKLVPGTGVVTPTWTTTAPTFSDAKQGWYGTAASAGHRYLEFSISYDGTNYYKAVALEKTKNYTYVNAYMSSNYTALSAAIKDPIIFDTEVYDQNDEYDNTTGIFTPNEDGTYLISGNVTYAWSSGTQNMTFWRTNVYYDNNIVFQNENYPNNTTIRGSHSFSIPIKAEKNKQIKIKGHVAGGTGSTYVRIEGNTNYVTSLKITKV